MQIEVRGRNVEITDELRAYAEKRFSKVAKQVAEQATLELELKLEHGSGSPEQVCADAALHLKGSTLRASDHSRDAQHAVHLVSDELAVQVKRHQAKRRARRSSRDIAAPVDGTAVA